MTSPVYDMTEDEWQRQQQRRQLFDQQQNQQQWRQLFDQQQNQQLYRGNTNYPRMAGLYGYGANPYTRNQGYGGMGGMGGMGGYGGGMGGYQPSAGLKGGVSNPYGRGMSPYASQYDRQNWNNAYMNPFNMGSRSGYNMMGGFGMGMGMSPYQNPLQYQPSPRMYPSPFGGPFPLNTFPRNPYNTGTLYGQPMQYAGMFGHQTGYNPYQAQYGGYSGGRPIVYPRPVPTSILETLEQGIIDETVPDPVPTDTATTPATTTPATTTPATVTLPTTDYSNWGNAEWAEWLKNNPIDLSNIYNSIRF